MRTFNLTWQTLPATCPACGATLRRQYEVLGLNIADYFCGLSLKQLVKSYVVNVACPEAMGAVIQLRAEMADLRTRDAQWAEKWKAALDLLDSPLARIAELERRLALANLAGKRIDEATALFEAAFAAEHARAEALLGQVDEWHTRATVAESVAEARTTVAEQERDELRAKLAAQTQSYQQARSMWPEGHTHEAWADIVRVEWKRTTTYRNRALALLRQVNIWRHTAGIWELRANNPTDWQATMTALHAAAGEVVDATLPAEGVAK